MSQEIDGDTLTLLIMIAVIYWQLGRSIGRAPPHDTDTTRKAGDGAVLALGKQAAAPVNPQGGADDGVRWKGIAEPGSVLARDLSAVQMADRSFEAHRFLDGASAAYEAVVVAFAAGDDELLESLLSDEVYDVCAQALVERSERGERLELSFIALESAEIAEAAIRAGSALITVRFVSQIITATRDRTGEIVDGDPLMVVQVEDFWTFSREIASRDPNWKIITTASA